MRAMRCAPLFTVVLLLTGMGAQAQPVEAGADWQPVAAHAATQPDGDMASYQVASLLQPSLNITPEQLAMAARRQRLPFASKLECSALDTRLPRLERNARRSTNETRSDAEASLQQARQRYARLGC